VRPGSRIAKVIEIAPGSRTITIAVGISDGSPATIGARHPSFPHFSVGSPHTRKKCLQIRDRGATDNENLYIRNLWPRI
jgi:hypothetical protein